MSLFHQMYAYAEKYEFCEKDYSVHVRVKTPDDNEHGIPFSEEELKILWTNQNDRKRMLGHAFTDITNKVYGHRTVEALREEIEKIKIPIITAQ